MKIRIFQPIVPEYRVALFNGVGRHYGECVEIWASAGDGQDKSYPLEEMRFDYSHAFRKVGPFRWQKGLSVKGLTRGDVIVICGDVHQLSSLWVAWKAKCRGIGVVWWGHHKTAMSKSWKVRLRLWFTKRLASVVLCYTAKGIRWLLARGFKEGRVFATGNTINQKPIHEAVKIWNSVALERFKKENGLDGKKVLLFCSVLRAKTKFDQLIRALAEGELAKRNDIVVAVIGDGEERENYQRLAKELNLENRFLWLGATRDQNVMAPWFLSSKLFVYPGSIGLSILHSFSYGLPVVAHSNAEHQMPEFEAMKDGVNGLCFQENDWRDLAIKILSVIDDDERLEQMKREALKTAADYSMDKMVEHYIEAIEATHRLCVCMG